MIAREKDSHPVFGLFGGEERMRIALAFVPDPEKPVPLQQIVKTSGQRGPNLLSTMKMLCSHGLLEQGPSDEPGRKEFTRVESPLWAIYETAKVALGDIGIEFESIVPSPEPEQ